MMVIKFKRFFSVLSTLIDDTKGNIAVIFALGSLLLMGLVFFMLDASNQVNHKKEMQAVVDQAVLAACRLGTLPLKQASINAHLSAVIDPTKVLIDDVNVTVDSDGATTLTMRHTLQQDFLLFPNGSKTFITDTQCSYGDPHLEVTFVVDVSHSMNHDGSYSQPKILEAQAATLQFLDDLLTSVSGGVNRNISISIIPFATSVNVSNSFTGGFDWPGCSVMLVDDIATLPATIPIGTPYPPNLDYRCPPETEKAIFNSKNLGHLRGEVARWATTNYEVIKDQSTANHYETLAFGTSTEVGTTWGVWSLHPKYQGVFGGDFNNRPADLGETEKIMVILTDGGITKSWDIYVPKLSVGYSRDDAKEKFLDACALARGPEIQAKVYTISYDIISADLIQLLEVCAGDANNHFHAPTGDLSKVFDHIVDLLKQVKLTM